MTVTNALNQLALAVLMKQRALTPAERQALADLNAAVATVDRGDNRFATLREVP